MTDNVNKLLEDLYQCMKQIVQPDVVWGLLESIKKLTHRTLRMLNY